MNEIPPASHAIFRRLCKVLGGLEQPALQDCIAAGLLPLLFATAQRHDQLPALAVRCNEQNVGSSVLGEERAALLRQALWDNTRRNMQISAQAVKIAGRLNQAGIVPLFLKGTARLLAAAPEHLGFRQQTDIDFIVKPAQLIAAGDVLLLEGYSYYQFSPRPGIAPRRLGNTAEAIKHSAGHHHLPPLAKAGYAATVELHSHFLDKRFQRANPLEPLFASARQLESHGVTFQVPATEYQIIHLVLGKLVNDGHLSRRSFPLREACDSIDLLQALDEHTSDLALIEKRCGKRFSQWVALVAELMGYSSRTALTPPADIAGYLWLMGKRDVSALARALLNSYARGDYLAHALLYSPAKLRGYFSRLLSAE